MIKLECPYCRSVDYEHYTAKDEEQLLMWYCGKCKKPFVISLKFIAKVEIYKIIRDDNEIISLHGTEIILSEKFQETMLQLSIQNREWSQRIKRILAQNKIETIGDLVSYNAKQLLSFKGFGRKGLNEVINFLHDKYGLGLSRQGNKNAKTRTTENKT